MPKMDLTPCPTTATLDGVAQLCLCAYIRRVKDVLIKESARYVNEPPKNKDEDWDRVQQLFSLKDSIGYGLSILIIARAKRGQSLRDFEV